MNHEEVPPFSPGEIVYLKSGSFPFTVEICDKGSHSVKVWYWDGNKVIWQSLPQIILTKEEPPLHDVSQGEMDAS